MAKEIVITEKCHDCGVKIGELHIPGCDVERCADCGGGMTQAISCDHEDYIKPRLPWTGEFPGCKEARELGFWCKWVEGKGWARCEESDPEAVEDLNRYSQYCRLK